MDDGTDASRRTAPAGEPRVDANFRNGTVTAISVLLGFSLSFLTRWAGYPGDWSVADLVGLITITAGIGAQVWSLARLLSVQSLVLANHDRIVRMFLAGLVLVGAGVLLAIVGGLVGLGRNVLAG